MAKSRKLGRLSPKSDSVLDTSCDGTKLDARLDSICAELERLARLSESVDMNVKRIERSMQSGREASLTGSQRMQQRCKNSPDDWRDGATLLGETLISLTQAAKLIPASKLLHSSTISRWCTTGVRGIKLESELVGGRRVTSNEAVFRFLEMCRKNGFRGMADGATIAKAMAAKEEISAMKSRQSRR
jgi:Protein of unknown function (DUF1580)